MNILKQWKLMSYLPGGKRLFSWALGWGVPYAGSIRPVVEKLEPGYARVKLYDHRGVRNHLGSVHACALANLGELTGGLAMVALQPPNGRFIPYRMEVDYLKKARGTLTADCRLPYAEWVSEGEWIGEVPLMDEGGDVVSRVKVFYKVGFR